MKQTVRESSDNTELVFGLKTESSTYLAANLINTSITITIGKFAKAKLKTATSKTKHSNWSRTGDTAGRDSKPTKITKKATSSPNGN